MYEIVKLGMRLNLKYILRILRSLRESTGQAGATDTSGTPTLVARSIIHRGSSSCLFGLEPHEVRWRCREPLVSSCISPSEATY